MTTFLWLRLSVDSGSVADLPLYACKVEHIDHMSKTTTNIGGDRFNPLTVEQTEAFHEAAVEASDPKEELVGLTLLYTGLRNSAFHHMRSDWLEYSDSDKLHIVVPDTEICTGGVGKTGKDNEDGSNLHDRGSPCHNCRKNTPKWVRKAKRDTDYHDELWHPKTKAGAGRSIPVQEEDAAEIIEWWFDANEEVPVLHNAVNRRIDNIRERAGIKRPIPPGQNYPVTAHDLRNTYGTTLARKGFDDWYIKQVLGHANVLATQKYIKFVGHDLDNEFDEKW